MRIESDRRYLLNAATEPVWAAMTQVEDYQRWWPWLHRFDGAEVAQGQRWNCVVRPPLPYRVGFTVIFDDVRPEEAVAATIEGDITGEARFDLVDKGSTCEVRLRSSLAPANPALALLASVARPVVTFGHNWVLDAGARQFGEHVDLHRLDG